MTRFAAAVCAAWMVAACGAATYDEPSTVPRRQAGRVVVGAPVSPSSFEAFVRGERAASLEAWPEAVQQYRVALAGAVEDPYVLGRLAVALAHAGRPDDAAQALARGDAVDANSEAVAIARGEVALVANDRGAAAAAFTRACDLAPGSPRGPILLADALVAAGDPARALDVLRRFAGTRDVDRAAVARARLRIALVRGDAAATADAVHALLAVAPARRDELARAAETLLATDPEAAYRLLSSTPRLREVALLARAAAKTGRRGEAEALVATHGPAPFGGPLDAARLLLEVGSPERARVFAEDAIDAGGGPAAERVAGDAALAAHDWPAAAAHYARVPPGAADFADARRGLALALEAQALPQLGAELLARPR